jgi:membrane-associated phospholipid phosphatase
VSLTSSTYQLEGESPPGGTGSSGPELRQKRGLLIGFALLGAVALGGLYFSRHPGLNPVDRLAFRIVPNEWTLHPLKYVADLGRPRVVIPAVACCFFIALFWNRRRAITCVLAPSCAIAITEYIAKPAVGRTFGGTLCYPSGHMTAVMSVIAVFVLAVPPRFKKLAVLAGVLVGALVGVTLMMLRWHYLTDVLAGASVAIGTALVIDYAVQSLPALAWFKTGQT